MDAAGKYGGSISSGTRGIHAGGQYQHSSGNWYGSDKIEYITIGSTGNGTDFGNLNATAYSQGASTNGILGTVFGGYRGGVQNETFSITIASAGDSTDVGNLTEARSSVAGVSSATMSIHCGGYKGGSPSRSNVIDYTSWGSLGDSSDFGDLTIIGSRETPGEDSSRGIVFGAYTDDTPNTTDNIDYFNTASTGSAYDFGNTLSHAYHSSWGSNLGGTYSGGAMCNGVRMDVAGGNTQGGSGYAETAKIQYITIQTTGDATDYGDDVDDWDGDGEAYSVRGCSGN